MDEDPDGSPHIHCIIPSGGLSTDNRKWIAGRKKFFIPVKVLSRIFRGKFLRHLKKAYGSGEIVFPGKVQALKDKRAFDSFLADLYAREWVVYCKPPLKRPESVINYLGRYTHRVALSNDRIAGWKDGSVTIRYRSSESSGETMQITLDAFEFIRRFLLHILPDGFMKIRHYGILSNRNRKEKLARCRQLLGMGGGQYDLNPSKVAWEDLLLRLTGLDPRVCPCCGKGRMVPQEVLAPSFSRPPP